MLAPTRMFLVACLRLGLRLARDHRLADLGWLTEAAFAYTDDSVWEPLAPPADGPGADGVPNGTVGDADPGGEPGLETAADALAAVPGPGWKGRHHRVAGDLHWPHGDIGQAAAAFEAEQHDAPGERATAQVRLALMIAFADPVRAGDGLDLAPSSSTASTGAPPPSSRTSPPWSRTLGTPASTCRPRPRAAP
ncbi:hypothetical protein [Streptomyces jumonjinensis]|uniref:hypothetical protein n=1 Tax=Streptomyces jumonjinensis TaxID=1945 RepID=UPI003795661C